VAFRPNTVALYQDPVVLADPAAISVSYLPRGGEPWFPKINGRWPSASMMWIAKRTEIVCCRSHTAVQNGFSVGKGCGKGN
jgi:hypothetical protein